MQCDHFDAGRCRSCTFIDHPYREQVATKEALCRRLLDASGPGRGPGPVWEPAVVGPQSGFRNKAKMVVAGTTTAPTVGILDDAGHGVDLRDCGLYPAPVHTALAALAAFITTARLEPYDVGRRSGELKNLLVTVSPDDELMVRFVLRSQEPLTRIVKHLPALYAALPGLRVVSANLLPEHKAAVEGDREIILSADQTLRMRVNGLDLHLRPRSFFQTNTVVAAALYRQARDWVAAADPRVVWDLYCGVGGFALHVADGGRQVTGVETSAEAVASARHSAAEAGLSGTTFVADDATAFAVRSASRGGLVSGPGGAPEAVDVGAKDPARAGAGDPDLVIVNPPRRGIGADLARWLEGCAASHIVYSSCNAVSLARDLRDMPSWRPARARVLDMFPHTGHYEVITLLERR